MLLFWLLATGIDSQESPIRGPWFPILKALNFWCPEGNHPNIGIRHVDYQVLPQTCQNPVEESLSSFWKSCYFLEVPTWGMAKCSKSLRKCVVREFWSRSQFYICTLNSHFPVDQPSSLRSQLKHLPQAGENHLQRCFATKTRGNKNHFGAPHGPHGEPKKNQNFSHQFSCWPLDFPQFTVNPPANRVFWGETHGFPLESYPSATPVCLTGEDGNTSATDRPLALSLYICMSMYVYKYIYTYI